MAEGLPSPPPNFMKLCLSPEGRTPLKERFKKGRITEYTAEQFASGGKSATDRLRELDYIRMHTPHEDEVEQLNVTPYRMDLFATQDVLYLCGGLVGVRFSSEDLLAVVRITKAMSGIWNDISLLYKNMSTASKKLPMTDSDCPEDVVKFHALADRYVALFVELQSMIREKQSLIDPSTPSTRTDAPKLDADPESHQGRRFPEWLSTLLEKHQRSKADDVSSASKAAGGLRSSHVRVGELSVFLSGCVAGITQCTDTESEALAVLVQASNDTFMSVSNADIHAVTDVGGRHRGRAASPTLFPDGVTPRSQRYWAKRFYNFLSKMSELASAVKDEAALEHM